MQRFTPLAFTLMLITACGSGGVGTDTVDGGSTPSSSSQAKPTGDEPTAPADTARPAVTLSVSASPSTGGNVAVDPPAPYQVGDTVHITATAAAGYELDGWIGSESREASLTVTLSADTTLSAQFSRIPATLNVTAQPPLAASVTISPAGPHYVGDSVTVSVVVQPGYVIQDWSDGNGVDGSRTVTLTGNQSLGVTLVAVPIVGGPDTHIGNETDYSLSWTYAWDQVAPLTGYAIEESYDGGAFLPFDGVSTSGTTITVTIPVTRAPATHCYRVRAHLGSSYSPYGNTHCVERLPGPKRVMIINDLPSWRPSGSEFNGIVRVHVGVGDPLGTMNLLGQTSASLPGGTIAVGGGTQSFDTAGQPASYSVGFVAGYWDDVCSFGCSWDVHSLTVTACDEHSLVLKGSVVNITTHTFDTIFIHTKDWLPVGNYGMCTAAGCAQDPICSR